MNPIFKKNLLVLLLAGTALSACSRTLENPTPTVAQAKPAIDVLDQVQEDETVLVTVNGSRIGQSDLTINLIRTLGDAYPQFADAGVEEQVLQSMVASRAIAMKTLANLSVDEQVSLEKRVAQFREELLVKQYLVENAGPQAVTAEQVANYYNENLEEFAGTQERLYELVTIDSKQYKQDTGAALQSLNRAKTHDDWRKLAVSTQDQPHPVVHSFQTMIGDEAQGAIEDAVTNLNEGEMSRIILSDGAPYLVRLLEITRQAATPLAQASAGIRQRLLPASIKASVRSISNSVVEQSDVVFTQVAD